MIPSLSHAVDETDSKLGVAKSATLGANTPFKESFGASTGKSYLTVGLDAGKPKGKVTLTCDVPPVPGTYGIALGDVDAEEIIITALGPDGQPVSTRVTITGPSSANRTKVSLSRVYFVRG